MTRHLVLLYLLSRPTLQFTPQLPTGHIWSILSCISTFFGEDGGGWDGLVIINLKANLSSTDTGLASWN